MSKRTRRHFTVEQKAAILRRHLEDKVPVSDLCNEAKIQPSMFYERFSCLGPSERRERAGNTVAGRSDGVGHRFVIQCISRVRPTKPLVRLPDPSARARVRR